MKIKNRILICQLFVLVIVVTTTNSCKKEEAPSKIDPVITWENPADISLGTWLSATQLNATADMEGTFVYTPPIGTVLSEGPSQNLKVDFKPIDSVNYNTATKTVTINVKKGPVIIWANPADIISGTALSATQLNATADVPGTFVYTPAIGIVLNVGTAQNLHVDFTPTDAVTYNTATKTVTINVKIAQIGNRHQGGKIAYIFQEGDPGYFAGQIHGLIAAETDQGIANQWEVGSNTTGATGTALGTGSANTTLIINSQGNTGTYAAKICRDYAGGGFNDWYLPSKDELNKLYLNNSAIGGFTSNFYWSSSETNPDTAWDQYFGNGYQRDNGSKGASLCVRAVRTF